MNLKQLREKCKSCRECPLHKGRTQVVFGEGPEDASIVLVGEGPGEQEDLKGKPFCGRAGKILDRALKEAGLSRKELYITNIVKCRPPDNRDPRKEERETCVSLYLLNQLELIKPEVVVTLGRVPLKTLLDEDSVSHFRGKILKRGWGDWTYLPTYHPAAILYTRELEEKLTQDLKLVKRLFG